MFTNELTQAAQQKVDELRKKEQEIKNADRNREPKLTDDEKKEIANDKALMAELAPQIETLLAIQAAKEARLQELQQHLTELVLGAEDPDKVADELAAELVRLPPLVKMLFNDCRALSQQHAQAGFRIEHIIDDARAREIREEHTS